MKVMQQGVMKILPGKMAEAMELNEKYMAGVSRLGMPTASMRMYRPFVGGEYMHTLVFEVEWDSMLTMAAFMEKMMADPEMQTLMPKWDTLIESHEAELYVPMS